MRLLGWLLTLLCVSSCIEPNLEVCNGFACPVGRTCVVVEGQPRCATGEEIAECANQSDLAPCSTGVCVNQVCVPAECGNGREELEEQCDDGNTAAADGCSATCTDEICGNGVTDASEACDCGEPGTTPRPECNGFNNTDTDSRAPCRSDCKLRSCGDGMLNAPEPCDGALLAPGASCTSLGFYEGTLACSAFCTFDTGGCSRKCGDGVLDVPEEECEGSNMGGQTCASFGFYDGTLGCTACRLTTTACTGRCGDGVVNASEGEQCDGQQFLPAITCETFGFYEGPQACTSSCTLDTAACSRTCGDTVLDPEEQCEGSSLGGRTCADFGFYGGNLACTGFCAYATAGCVGSCGDNNLDPQEYCDPSLGSSAPGYCTDFGYSTGQMTCSAACGASFKECRDPTTTVDLFPGETGFIDLVPGGTAGTAWIVLTQEVIFYELGTIHRYPLPATFPSTPKLLDISSAGPIAAASADNATVLLYSENATVNPQQTLTAPFNCTQIVMTTPTRLLCLSGGQVAWWTNGTWSAPMTTPSSVPPIEATTHGSNVMYSDYDPSNDNFNGRMNLVSATTITEMGGGIRSMRFIDRVDDGWYGGTTYGGAGGIPDQVYLPESSTTWQLASTEPPGRYGVADIGGMRVWSNGIESVTYVGTSSSHFVSPVLGPFTSCRRLVEVGPAALCLDTTNGRVVRFAGASSGMRAAIGVTVGVIRDVYIDERDVMYATSTTGDNTMLGFGDWRPALDTVIFDRMAGRSSTQIALLGKTAPNGFYTHVARWDGVDFTVGVASSDITAFTHGVGGEVVVSLRRPGECAILRGVPDVIFASAPIAIIAPCPTSIWVSPTGDVWTASHVEVRNITDNVVHPLQPSLFATGGVVGGVDDTHVWAASSDRIWFYDGSTFKVQLNEFGQLFDWIHAAGPSYAIATAGNTTWIYGSAGRWTKMRLPSDPTPLVQPTLRPWGVFYRSPTGVAQLAVWQNNWP